MNKPKPASLDAYERWMVQVNLQKVQTENADGARLVAVIRANGYPRVAAALERALEGNDHE